MLYINGVKKGASEKELSEAIRNAFLKATDNLSWLSQGDLVLLKPALNSSDPYPATTHPLSVQVTAEILKERGAKVIAGDQSGIEHVVQTQNGILKGSSRDCLIKSGLIKAIQNSGIKFTAFEEEDWNKGFYHFQPAQKSSWKNGFFIARCIQKADHIINLPRISCHGITGTTLGFKNMIGVLRQDSRLELHKKAPFYFVADRSIKGGNLNAQDENHSNSFFKKITEISLALQKKLRAVLFVATKAQTTFGPDKFLLSMGKRRYFKSYTAEPETGLVLASSNPLACEVAALALLTILYSKTPLYHRMLQKILVLINGKIKELGKESIWQDPFLRHAIELGLGSSAFETKYQKVPDKLQNELSKLMQKVS